MKIEEQVCTLEQAKKLKGLGVEQVSMAVWFGSSVGPCLLYRTEPLTLINEWAAYTVAELGKMLPTGFDTMRIHSEDYDKELWYIYGDTGDWFIKNGFDTEAECRAETVIKLIESNLITIEQINKRL